MRIMRLGWMGLLALILLVVVPTSGSASGYHGNVTVCVKSTTNCYYGLNTSKSTGWATTTSTHLSFKLPWESKASYNLTYATYVQKLTGYYTYWTIGNFHGTDVNTGYVVYGTTNTNFTITAHCQRGCTYTYTTDNGTIVFRFTKAYLTSTSVSCNPSSFNVSGTTTCTAKVSNLWNSSNNPTGKVLLSTAGLGNFSGNGKCSLSSGKCSLTFQSFDNTIGSVTIWATYSGTSSFYKSSGSTIVDVLGGGD